MNLVRNVASVLATSAVRVPIQFVTSIVLARYLAVDDRGVYALALALAQTLATVAELGWGPASIYRLRRVQSHPARVASTTLFVVLTLSAVTILVCLPLRGWISHRFLDDAPPLIFLLTLAIFPVHLLSIVSGSVARGLDRFILENGALLLTHVTRLVGFAAVLIYFGGDLRDALVVFLGTELLGTLVVLGTVLRQTGLEPRVDGGEIREGFGFGLRAYAYRLAATVHERFDMFVIAYLLSDPKQVAYYVIAKALQGQLRMLPHAVGLALFPQLAGTPEESTGELTARVLRHTLAFVVLATVAVAAASPLIPVIYSAPYAASIAPFLILLPGLALFSVQRLVSNYFGAVGRQRAAIQSQVIAAGVNVVLNLLLIPELGILGAALASLASNAASAALIIWFFCQDSGVGLLEILRPRRGDLEVYRRRLLALRDRARRSAS